MSNTVLWDSLTKSDPKHTKPFSRAGGFKGTSLKPIWMTHRMTEAFGPCGVGWGMERPEFQVVTADKEILVYCTTALWHSDRANIVYGVGGDKVMTVRNNGNVFCDDEAFKKAYTDSLSNAMKQIGMAADIHMGLHDDDKYVQEMREEFDDTPAPATKDEICTALGACTSLDELAATWVAHGARLRQMQLETPDDYHACVEKKEAMKADPLIAGDIEREAIQGEAT